MGLHLLQTQHLSGEEVDARDAFKLLRRVMLPPQWLPEGSEPLEVSAVKSAKVQTHSTLPADNHVNRPSITAAQLLLVDTRYASLGTTCRLSNLGYRHRPCMCSATGPGIRHAEGHGHRCQIPARQRLCDRAQRQ